MQPKLSLEQRTVPAPQDLGRLELLAKILDSAVTLPGGFRIGLDPLIGLIPGIGDVLMSGVGCYLVYESARRGASRPLLFRMLGNLGVEAVVGCVPVLGDLFDVAWRANEKNLTLLRGHLAENPTREFSRAEVPRRILSTVAVLLAAFFLGTVALAYLVIRGLVALFQ